MQRLVNIAGGVGLGIMLSQVPAFMQQYQQRLGGAVDELRVITQDFDRAAIDAGLTHEAALETYDSAQNGFLSQRGTNMRTTFERYERLSEHLAGVQNADPLGQLVPFVIYVDPQLAQNTFRNFEAAVPVTTQGLIFAGAGFLGGFSLASAIGSALGRRFGKRGARPT